MLGWLDWYHDRERKARAAKTRVRRAGKPPATRRG
jgi:hypothetical protein